MIPVAILMLTVLMGPVALIRYVLILWYAMFTVLPMLWKSALGKEARE